MIISPPFLSKTRILLAYNDHLGFLSSSYNLIAIKSANAVQYRSYEGKQTL